MTRRILSISLVLAACVGSANAGELFRSVFEDGTAGWYTLPYGFWGPHHLETWPHTDNHTPECVNPDPCDPRGETAPQCPCTAAHEFEHSQVWCSWEHDETPNPDRSLRMSAWFLDLMYRTDRTEINFVHFQVQGWITLMDPTGTEHFLLGIHAHTTNPDENWLNYSWRTATDGWQVTNVPRQYGWRHFEIVVHPYTGAVGDVEFFIDGQLVGQGQRLPGEGAGVPITRARIGSDPAFLPEDNVANTYQRIYYDDVTLTQQDTGDFDFDGDVDLSDFATFLGCFNGPGRPAAQPGCEPADFDGDMDVDLADFGTYLACFNGPNRPAADGCPP